MFLNDVITLRGIAADKTYLKNEESKGRELQSLSLRQPTDYRTVVQSSRQNLAKNKK